MVITGIDKDFIDIIEYLNSKGFKTFASCDGVIQNHTEGYRPNDAYISFMNSEKIIDLMAAFMRDFDTFSVDIQSCPETKPYELYGNMISGNTYTVYFSNKEGEKTEYFKKIIRSIAEGKVKVTDEEKKKLALTSKAVGNEKTNLAFDVSFNYRYQPYMKKPGRINVLTIKTKEGLGYEINMEELAHRLAEKYGVTVKLLGKDWKFEESEYINCIGSGLMEFYFEDNTFTQVLDMIQYANMIQGELSTYRLEDIDDKDIEETDR